MPSGGKLYCTGSQYSKQEKETCEEGKDLVKVVWFAEAVERPHQNPPNMFLHRCRNLTLPRLRMLASTERDAKDFKMASRSIVPVGVSVIDLHERKGQIDIVDWLFVASL